MSRTKNAIKNTKYGIVSKIISLLLGFASRTVFIYYLGNTLLGINGLYTELLSLLSFADLGFGTAMTFAMYAPVAHEDHKRIVSLLAFYKKIYRIVAIVILSIGLCLLPFLQYLVKGADTLSTFDLRLYFVLFLINTVVSYFVTYKYSYINALQKNYLITKIDTILNLVVVFVQIVIIVVFRNFFLYLLAHTVLLSFSRIVIALYLNRLYPILNEKPKEELAKDDKKKIYHEVRGVLVHRIADVAVHQTDNILISSLTEMGVVAVGFVSNYNLLINTVLGFVIQLFESVSSGFGNLAAASSKANFRKVFSIANFINFWIYGFCCIAFFILIPPFITLWIGGDKLIDTVSFLLIIINCYLMGQCRVFNNARNAIGNFNKDKWWALVQAIVNLVVSIVCAKRFGLMGIFIGTVASRMVYVIFRPYSTYRLMFDRSCLEYYEVLIKYLISTALAGVITWYATYQILQTITLARFAIATVITFILPNCIFLLLYYRTTAFEDVLNRVKTIKQKNNE